MNYDYVLPAGTKIVLPDNEHNKSLGLVDVTLGKVYTVAGLDSDNDCYFYDDVGEKDYAGFAINGEDGVFEIVGGN